MASSVSPCSAKVFIRFDSRSARLVLDARHCPAHIPPQLIMVLSMLSAFLSPFALASTPRNAHKAMRLPSHTRRARSKKLDAFTVDVVRRDVRQTRKTGAIFCSRYSYSSAFVSAMPDLWPHADGRGRRSAQGAYVPGPLRVDIGKKERVFNHRLVACGCGMTTVPSPDTGASFRGIIASS